MAQTPGKQPDNRGARTIVPGASLSWRLALSLLVLGGTALQAAPKLTGGVWLEYLHLPLAIRVRPLERQNSGLYRVFALPGQTYLAYYNIGYDAPDKAAALRWIREDPGGLFKADSFAIKTETEKRSAKGMSYVLIEGRAQRGGQQWQWMAAVVENKRYQGPDQSPIPTAGIAYIFGKNIAGVKPSFVRALHASTLTADRSSNWFTALDPGANYKIRVPGNFKQVGDPSGAVRLVNENGAFILLDHHRSQRAKSERMAEGLRTIEKGYYGFLFAKEEHKLGERKKVTTQTKLELTRIEASVRALAPFSSTTYGYFFVFPTEKGIGIVVMSGALPEKETFERIVGSIEAPRVPTPWPIGHDG